MSQPKFSLEVSYSETTGQPVAAYVRIRQGKVAETKEISTGAVFADYEATGDLLGIELLAPCPEGVLDRLSEKEPELVRNFLRDSVRRPLAFA